MATLAHALSLLSFLAPLVIFFIKRESKFVSFHALQAVLWHVAYLLLVFVLTAAFLAVFIFTIVTQVAAKGAPPLGLFIFFPVFWLVLVVGGILNLILAVVYAIKAGQGEWADYPIFGGLARKILKMGPTA